MIDLLPWNAWSDALSESALLLLFLIPGLLFYGALADQALFENRGRVQVQGFDPIDLWIAGILTGLFVLLIAGGWRDANKAAESSAALPSASAMIMGVIVNAVMVFAIIFGILTGLSARRIKWWHTFGFTALNPSAVLARGIVSLVLALPLVFTGLLVSHVLLSAGGGDDDSKQEIVRFLGRNESGVAKAVVAMSAILLAPLQEEFIFRGYIYGVVRRYAGVPVGILVNAALFAGVHLHAPSFGGLFVLAVCLTLAYEWTGSLFVPMAMHALFNSLNIVQLLSGGAG